MEKETKEKILQTVKIICNAIIAIVALWLAISCTMSMSIQKNTSSSTQKVEQTSKNDSISINVPSNTKKNN